MSQSKRRENRQRGRGSARSGRQLTANDRRNVAKLREAREELLEVSAREQLAREADTFDFQLTRPDLMGPAERSHHATS